MRHAYTFGPAARVAVVASATHADAFLASGPVHLCLHFAEGTARALLTELLDALPPGASNTKRPAAPRFNPERPTNWPAVIGRLRTGKTQPGDVEAVAHLLCYLGVKTA